MPRSKQHTGKKRKLQEAESKEVETKKDKSSDSSLHVVHVLEDAGDSSIYVVEDTDEKKQTNPLIEPFFQAVRMYLDHVQFRDQVLQGNNNNQQRRSKRRKTEPASRSFLTDMESFLQELKDNNNTIRRDFTLMPEEGEYQTDEDIISKFLLELSDCSAKQDLPGLVRYSLEDREVQGFLYPRSLVLIDASLPTMPVS